MDKFEKWKEKLRKHFQNNLTDEEQRLLYLMKLRENILNMFMDVEMLKCEWLNESDTTNLYFGFTLQMTGEGTDMNNYLLVGCIDNNADLYLCEVGKYGSENLMEDDEVIILGKILSEFPVMDMVNELNGKVIKSLNDDIV